MMNCEAFRILISGYLDEELSEQEVQLLKAHLQGCESCVSYLQHQEALKNALKHYTLFQESLEVPSDFAKKVVIKLQETLRPQRSPLAARIKRAYHHFVFGFVDSWINSLKTRPFTWATVVSCMFVLMVGLVSFKVVQQMSWREQARIQTFGVEPPSPVPAPSALSKVSQTSRALQGVSSPEQVNFESQEVFQAIELTLETRNMAQEVEESNGLIVEEEDSPFIRVASHQALTVEDYVYSHVVEVYQTHFVDDAVFVGYVHGVFTQ